MSADHTDDALMQELTLDENALLDELLSELGESRRKFLGQSTTVALSALVLEFIAKRNALAGTTEQALRADFPGRERIKGRIPREWSGENRLGRFARNTPRRAP